MTQQLNINRDNWQKMEAHARDRFWAQLRLLPLEYKNATLADHNERHILPGDAVKVITRTVMKILETHPDNKTRYALIKRLLARYFENSAPDVYFNKLHGMFKQHAALASVADVVFENENSRTAPARRRNYNRKVALLDELWRVMNYGAYYDYDDYYRDKFLGVRNSAPSKAHRPPQS